MAKVKQILDIMRNFAPEEYKYSLDYDNVGLMVGNENDNVDGVMCCLDCSMKVLNEAVERKCNLVISHHPFIFSSIKNINFQDVLGKKIAYAIEHNINIYSAHTNLDFTLGGINDYCAQLVGIKNSLPLIKYYNDIGLGRIGCLDEPITAIQLKERLEKLFDDKYIQIIGDEHKSLKKLAIINGAGGGDSEYIDIIKNMDGDCLITAEVKHHIALYALESNVTIIEMSHYAMERAFIPVLTQYLGKELKQLSVNVYLAKEENPKK